MSLKAKLSADLKDAMRARDEVRLNTIRAVRAAITQQEVDTGRELDDAAIAGLIRGLRKQRIEAIAQYREGGREDLVAQEMREQQLLEAYLPAAPDPAAMEAEVKAIVAALQASSPRDMGRVMQAARDRLPAADGKLLSEVVKRVLGEKQT